MFDLYTDTMDIGVKEDTKKNICKNNNVFMTNYSYLNWSIFI